MQKYGLTDARDILERASARETAARVAAGTVAKALLAELDIDILSHVIQMGSARSKAAARPGPADLAQVDGSPVRCFDAAAEDEMVAEIKAAAKDGDSLGGIVEVLAYGVPVGLGSHVHWDRRLDALLARALMSIQAVKGVEIGLGFEGARRPGSQVHDPIETDPSKPRTGAIGRASNRAGGLEGGVTTGEPLVVRGAMKPISTLRRRLPSVDLRDGSPADAAVERSDVCAVPAAGVVGEAMVALVLADALLEKFGGDSVGELKRNLDGYLEYLETRGFGER
jgi:chorismate synthase